jgi:hypothetical protein
MSTKDAVGWDRFAARPVIGSLGVALPLLMSACASTGPHVTGWDEVTVAPGVTGTCESNPCRVFFQMPKGSGSYKVTGNGMTYGAYPAGQKVSLGSFFTSNTVQVPDAGVPAAYVYVPASR